MATRTGIDRRRARGTVGTVEDATQQLRRSFAAAEANLTRELQAVTERLVSDPSLLGAAARREQIRGVFADVAEMRADLDRQAQLFARGSLSKVYAAGASRASRALGLDPGAGSFSGAHRRALEVLATDTFDDLASATQFVEARAKAAIREASRVGVIVGAATGTSVPQDTAALVARFQRDGVTAFTAANGARWRLGTYAEMVARTKSASAYNTGTIIRAREAGTDVFGIVDGDRSGHEACLAYNGKTCSGSWAFANPILHPNCVRSFTPLPLHRGPVDYGEVQGTQAAADPDALDLDAAGRAPGDVRPELDDVGPLGEAIDLHADPGDRTVRGHLADLASLPASWQRALVDNGTRVDVGTGTVTSYPTSAYLAGVRPRGWPPGRTWDEVPGAYLPGANRVVIGGPGSGHGSTSLALHESAHALDVALASRFPATAKFPAANRVSESHGRNGFRVAYDEVVDAAPSGGINPYYRQAGDAGRSEMFAEAVAAYVKGPDALLELAGSERGAAVLRRFLDALL